MKKVFKIFSMLLSIVILVNIFSISIFASNSELLKTYTRPNGQQIDYYEDALGNKYIYENGQKILVAIPIETRILSASEAETLINYNARSVSSVSIPYSKIMNVGTGDFTDVMYLGLGRDSVYLKCSDYKPRLGKKGMSYYFFYSNDGTNWISELYINYDLSAQLRHFVNDGGYCYFKIRMWSYNGDINSCKLSVT